MILDAHFLSLKSALIRAYSVLKPVQLPIISSCMLHSVREKKPAQIFLVAMSKPIFFFSFFSSRWYKYVVLFWIV